MSIVVFDEPAAVAYFKQLSIFLKCKDDEGASQSDEVSQAMEHIAQTERSWVRGFVTDFSDLETTNRTAILHGRRIRNMLFELASLPQHVRDGDREFLVTTYFPRVLRVGEWEGEKYCAKEVERNFWQVAGRAFVVAANAGGIVIQA